MMALTRHTTQHAFVAPLRVEEPTKQDKQGGGTDWSRGEEKCGVFKL